MKTHIILRIFLFMIIWGLNSEIIAQRSLQKARSLKDNYNYAQALEYYKAYFALNTPSVEHMREVAESYFKINDTKNAELWLAKVVNSGLNNKEDMLNYAHLLRGNGKYDEAILYYEQYASLELSNVLEAERWIFASRSAKKWMETPSYYKVENAEVFNSEYADFGLMPLGEGFILTSDRKTQDLSIKSTDIYGWTGKPFLKLFHFSNVDLENNKANIQFLESVNNDYHNGPSSFNAINNKIYFTRTKLVRIRKSPMNTDPTSWIDYAPKNDYVSRLEIYSVSKNEGSWTDMKPFEFNKSDEYSVGHPAFSPCGKIMYFASDMPGGYGGTDIYYTTLNTDGSWNKPQNAGNIINTEGNEVFPYVAEDGSFYFSSNGHIGMGGLDIFMATGAKNIWAMPINMQYPINSNKDDFSIVFIKDNKKGYFASNRDGGKGDDDIYTFELLPPTNITVLAITKEKNSKNDLFFLPHVPIKIQTVSGTEIQLNTDENGKLFLTKDCNETLSFLAKKEGYFPSNATLTTLCKTYNDTMIVELILDKYFVGKTFTIKNIFYDFDKWHIRNDAKPDLDHIVQILIENPQINIELGSHTDSRGTNRYNERLSQRRAESAVNYIISRGIEKSRITAKGYGESQLINHCIDGVSCSEEEHQMNRRTEFKIISFN